MVIENLFGFLFWFFLVGMITACVQDLKRTEVDNWLNFLLFTGGSTFIIFSAIFSRDYWILIFGLFSFFVLFLLSEIVYRARIFAGGDYKLLIAMFAIFAEVGFLQTILNIGVFIFLLLVSGSVWGLCFSFFVYAKNFSSVNKEMKKFFKMKAAVMGLIISGFFLAFSFLEFLFLFIALFIIFSIFIFIFVKSIENKVMIKFVSVKDLREGDWLISDVKVRGKVIHAKWEGLNRKEINMLKNYKGKVKIKSGIPFVPSFLLAFLAFWFLKNLIFFGF